MGQHGVLAEDAIEHGVTNDATFETLAADIHGYGRPADGLSEYAEYEPRQTSGRLKEIFAAWEAEDRDLLRAEMVRQGVSKPEHVIAVNDGAHDELCRLLDRGVNLWAALDSISLPVAEAMPAGNDRPKDEYLGASVRSLMDRKIDKRGGSSNGRKHGAKPGGGESGYQRWFQLAYGKAE